MLKFSNSLCTQTSCNSSDSFITVDQFVLDVMKEGLKFQFTSDPGPYYEPNNRSCLENLEVVQDKVAGWLKSGAVKEVKYKPYVCSPLSVSEKFY